MMPIRSDLERLQLSVAGKMTKEYDSVYLSPHPDDAIFSCAGRIWLQRRQGQSVLIATMATRDPQGRLSSIARRLHDRGGMEPDSLEVRRGEDRQAAEILGADLIHGDLEDAVYRAEVGSNRWLYPSLRRLFGKIHPADRQFPEDLDRLIQELPSHTELVVPLSVGRHVDHRLVRAAAERVAAASLLYYEDFPYAERRRAVHRALRPRRAWVDCTTDLSLEAVAAKVRAASVYTSQIDLIFGSPRRLRQAIRRRARRLGGERYWRRQDDRPESD